MAARPNPYVPLLIGALALGGVVYLFQSVLEPVRDGCNTSLVPSTFAMALVPAHLAAAFVLAGCIWAIRRAATPTRGRAAGWPPP